MSKHTHRTRPILSPNLLLFTLGAMILSVFSPPALAAPEDEWAVIDAGWCDLVYMPFPDAPPAVQPAPQQPAASPSSSEEGFIPLFNGENLDGWIIQGMEKAGPKIEEGGVLQVGGWDYWAVITKESFKNFILRFDVKYDKKGNSGVLIHTPAKEVFKKNPLEIQLADDEGKKDETKWPGAIFGRVAPSKNAFKEIGEWNSVEIKYDAPRLWVNVNGETVQDGVDVSKLEGMENKLEEGRIALQRNDYKKAVYYRNLRIKRLPD